MTRCAGRGLADPVARRDRRREVGRSPTRASDRRFSPAIRPDEPGHELRRRVGEDLGRRAELREDARPPA